MTIYCIRKSTPPGFDLAAYRRKCSENQFIENTIDSYNPTDWNGIGHPLNQHSFPSTFYPNPKFSKWVIERCNVIFSLN